jgi:hypothetical protein
VGEVDDHVGTLRRRHQQLVSLHRRRQEAPLVAYLPERQPVGHPQDEEACVAAVEQAQAVAPLLDVERWPRGAVDDDRVAEELGIPERCDVTRTAAGRIGHEGDLQLRRLEPLEERAALGIEQRTVLRERAILNRDRDLVIRPSRRIAEGRRRSGQPGPVDVARAAAQHVEPRRPGVDVGAGHPQRVVVEPHRRCTLVVVVLEHGAARRPALTEIGSERVGPEAPWTSA